MNIEQRKELEGLDGWLIILGLRMTLGLLIVGTEIVSLSMNEQSDSVEFYGNLISFALFCGLLWLFSGKSENFPLAYIIINCMGLLVFLMASLADPAFWSQFLGIAFWEVIWFSYLYKSYRVKNTFVPAAALHPAKETQ